MGGEKIDLRSEPGKGSSFSFVLPFKVEAAAPAPNGTTDEFAGMRVLVVDDSATSYMYLEETLANWSVDVTVLNQGRMLGDRLREAAARRRPFSAVLLDHALPDATTAELLRTIRLDPALADTWVVLMSAFDFDPPREGNRVIKPDACIAKPVRQQLLRSALQAAREPREPDAIEEAPEAEVREAVSEPEGLLSLGLDVLVADDNVINREVAQAMLERVGCRVTAAEDGNAALDHAHRRRFDAILMDCQMPGMDGYAATAAIRRTETERRSQVTPIIALTANVLARDRTRCLEAGMNHFLAKPFTQDQLIAVLRPIALERGTLVVPPPVVRPAPEPRSVRTASGMTPVRTASGLKRGCAAGIRLMSSPSCGRDTASTVPLKILASRTKTDRSSPTRSCSTCSRSRRRRPRTELRATARPGAGGGHPRPRQAAGLRAVVPAALRHGAGIAATARCRARRGRPRCNRRHGALAQVAGEQPGRTSPGGTARAMRTGALATRVTSRQPAGRPAA